MSLALLRHLKLRFLEWVWHTYPQITALGATGAPLFCSWMIKAITLNPTENALEAESPRWVVYCVRHSRWDKKADLDRKPNFEYLFGILCMPRFLRPWFTVPPPSPEGTLSFLNQFCTKLSIFNKTASGNYWESTAVPRSLRLYLKIPLKAHIT